MVFSFMCFIVPIILLFIGAIDYKYCYWVLISISIILILYSWQQGQSLKSLGFRIDTIKKAIIYNAIFSLLIAIALIIAYLLDVIREPTIPEWKMFLAFRS